MPPRSHHISGEYTSTSPSVPPDPCVTGLDHVQLAMPPGGEAQARAFYGSALGMEEQSKPASLAARGGVWFRCGAQGLHLGIEGTFAPARKAHPAFVVADLSAARARLRTANAPIIEDSDLPGYERFYTEDPFGNRIEILHPLPQTSAPMNTPQSEADAAVKARVRATYTAAAAAYVTSPTHSSGPDLERLISLVNPKPGERALDLSTGGGHVALALARAGAGVTALDLTPAMLAAARAHIQSSGMHTVAYVVGDAERLPFLDASFDLVTVRIAPHHYADIAAAMCEVARVLVPGGRLGLVDNIVPEDSDLATLMNDWERRRDPSHVRAIPLSEWQAILANEGLRVSSWEVGRKRHDFATWAERTGMGTTESARLAHDMLTAGESARGYFGIEEDGNSVRAWQCEYVIARAERQDAR